MPKKKEVHIWTDGAYSFKYEIGGWAAVLIHNGSARILADYEKVATNNKMEALAVAKGLEALKQPCDVTIYTDSQYVVYGVMRIKRNSLLGTNIDEWERVRKAMNGHKVKVIKVRGHSKEILNELADKFAVASYTQRESVDLFIEDFNDYMLERIQEWQQ